MAHGDYGRSQGKFTAFPHFPEITRKLADGGHGK